LKSSRISIGHLHACNNSSSSLFRSRSAISDVEKSNSNVSSFVLFSSFSGIKAGSSIESIWNVSSAHSPSYNIWLSDSSSADSETS